MQPPPAPSPRARTRLFVFAAAALLLVATSVACAAVYASPDGPQPPHPHPAPSTPTPNADINESPTPVPSATVTAAPQLSPPPGEGAGIPQPRPGFLDDPEGPSASDRRAPAEPPQTGARNEGAKPPEGQHASVAVHAGAAGHSPRAFRDLGLRPPSHGPGGEPLVYLTFDDGPAPRWTPKIQEVLERYGARATFFVIGEEVDRHPEVVRRLIDSGHAVANHTYTHSSLVELDDTALAEEIEATDRAVVEAIGGPSTGTRCLRPPFGAIDAATIDRVARLGKDVVVWDIDTRDWSNPGVDAIAREVLSEAQPGAIVLMHDGVGDRTQTVAALEQILPELAARGYRFEVLCAGP